MMIIIMLIKMCLPVFLRQAHKQDKLRKASNRLQVKLILKDLQ